MSRDLDYYLAKIPPLHAGKPKFMAELAAVLQPFVDAQAFLQALPTYFDLDYAIGAQLDVCGQWIGRSRNIPVPLTDCFFTLGDPLRGLGKGVWINNDNPGVTYATLTDEPYRRMLRAKALANEWDGTVDDAQRAFDAFLPPAQGSTSFVDDYGFAMQGGELGQRIMTVGVSGQIPSVVDLEILNQNLIGLKPATVEMRFGVTSINGAPVFGLGADGNYVGGLGRGALAVEPAFILHAEPSLISGD